MNKINRLSGTSAKNPVLVFSGHTHKVHEFRIEKIRETERPEDTNFYYFTDDYSGKYFRPTTDGGQLLLRYLWLRANSPLLFTSGGLKKEKPQYREIRISGGSIASLEMKEIPSVEKTANFTPGCRSVALRANNGQYVCAEGGGGGEVVANRGHIKEWETFELIQLDDGAVALRANNGQYVCAEGGGGGKVVANRTAIGPWETFALVELEKAGQVALQSFNYPDHFIRHRNFMGEVTVIGTETDRKDATFRIVPGLAEQKYPSLQKEYVSLQSVNFPGYYLRYRDGLIKLDTYRDEELFKKSATFRLVPGLANRAWSSFESLDSPGSYLRHKNFILTLDKGEDDLFRKEATFKILSPPW